MEINKEKYVKLFENLAEATKKNASFQVQLPEKEDEYFKSLSEWGVAHANIVSELEKDLGLI